MATDNDNLAAILQDDLSVYISNIYDEMCLFEKRLAIDGSRQVTLLKENIMLFETRLRERDKYREKVRNTSEYSQHIGKVLLLIISSGCCDDWFVGVIITKTVVWLTLL